jgi:protease-4
VEEGPQVGVVQVETVITDSTAREGIKALRKFRKDEEIKAIVVRVDSPGGLVGPSQELYREITRTRKTKPVVASLGSVAASGGYYIASACDHIVASPGTITGSIGVISQTTQVQDLLALARIQTHTFKSGKYKDTGSPTRAMTEEDKAFMQGFVDQVHRQFVRDVAKGRKLDPARVKRVADGRILTGEQAKAHKLVDSLGNYSDALERAVKLAKATGEPVEVTTRRSKGLLSRLLDDAMESVYERARQALTQGTSLEVRDPRLR